MAVHFGAIGRARRTCYQLIVPFVLMLLHVPQAFAVTANPSLYNEYQPDGTLIKLQIRGDEHFHWVEDKDQFTVVRNRGWHEYARLNPAGKLVPSGLRVGHENPRAYGLSQRILPSAANRAASAKSLPTSSVSAPLAMTIPAGSIRNLVVLVQFSDHAGRALPSTSDLDTLFNSPGGDPSLAPTGSVRDVYLQNSYGLLELNSDIAAWVTVSGSESYYANGASGDSTLWQALREALDQLDSAIDFSQYDDNSDGYIDSITFLHSGYGAEWGGTDVDGVSYEDRIWSHRWRMQNPEWVSAEGVRVADYHISPALWGKGGSQIGRIGVIAHEIGHFFGLPDLYDTDSGGEGVGSFGLMGNSWGFNGSQLCPPHMSPWSKMQLGWIQPVELQAPGEYSIGQSQTHDEYFMISSGFSAGEYLLIENRQQAGFDCSLTLGGIAVWHIDDEAGFNEEGYPGKRWPQNGDHYRVALAQADGNFDLEKGSNRGDIYDLHRSSGVDAIAPGPDNHPNTDGYQGGQITPTGHTLSAISSPAEFMTFCFNGCSAPGGDPNPSDGFEAPSGLSASVSQSGKGKNAISTVALAWVDNSHGELNEDSFVIERCEESGKGKSKVCDFVFHASVGRDTTSFSESAGSGTYMYRVKARRDGSEDSAYSNEVKI